MSTIVHITLRATASFIDWLVTFIPTLYMLSYAMSVFPPTPIGTGMGPGGGMSELFIIFYMVVIYAYTLIAAIINTAAYVSLASVTILPLELLLILTMSLNCYMARVGNRATPKLRLPLIILTNIFSYIFFGVYLISRELTLEAFSMMLPLLTVTAIVLILTLMEFICRGSSVGKFFCSLKVVKKDASKLTFTDILERNYMKSLGLLLFPISILYYILKKELPWDYFSQTEIVRRRESENANPPPESPQSIDHNS